MHGAVDVHNKEFVAVDCGPSRVLYVSRVIDLSADDVIKSCPHSPLAISRANVQAAG